MRLHNRTFKGGINPPGYKELTNGKPITKAKDPKVVYIPLQQHIGAPCEPIVKVGEYVKMGQKIGDSESFISAPVHSSVSGIVKSIEPFFTPSASKDILRPPEIPSPLFPESVIDSISEALSSLSVKRM